MMVDTTSIPRCQIAACQNAWIVGPIHHSRDDCAPRAEHLQFWDPDEHSFGTPGASGCSVAVMDGAQGHRGACVVPLNLGMGPDAPVTENASGAKQSVIPAVFTTMPLRALWALSKLQKQGDDKYGPHNWRGISENSHLDHAWAHLLADRLGDVSDDHLLHATWRMLAALETRLDGGLYVTEGETDD